MTFETAGLRSPTANEKVQQEQQKLKKVLAKDLPALKREEAALAAARAEVAVAQREP